MGKLQVVQRKTRVVLKRRDGLGLWQFLQDEKIPFNQHDFPFLTTRDPPEVKAVFEIGEYLRLSGRGEAIAYLYHGLGKALNYVGPVLDTELPHGFNDHTDRHTLWVSQRGIELLHRAGRAYNGKDFYGSTTEVLMTLVGMLHDVGNLLGRDEHSEASMRMIKALFAGWSRKRPECAAVDYAISYHEEPILKREKKALAEGIPLQWALVLADKMHFGRDRIGGRSFRAGLKEQAFEHDVHVLLESLVVRSSWFLRSGVFVWHLDFSVDQLEDKFKSFTRGQSRLWVPNSLQRLFEDRGQKYRETFKQLFLEHYGARVKMASEAAFLLMPYIKRFEVWLSDTDTRGKVGNGDVKVWSAVI